LKQLHELGEVGAEPWSSLYILGAAHYRAGEDDQAIQRLKEALAGPQPGPLSLLGYPVLAMAYHRQGRTTEARAALDEAAKTLDQWTQERYVSQQKHWVIDLGAEGVWPVPWWDYLECESYYREAKILIDGSPPPDDPRLHVLRARAFAGMRWPKKAVTEYDAALELIPQDLVIRLEAHRSRGSHFVELRQWKEAAAEFTKASELRPDDSYLWRFRAVANIAQGDADAYRQTCATMLDRFEKTDDAVTAGNVLLSCVLREDALPDMSRLLPLTRVADPIWHWGTWVRGAALYRAGRYEESVRCFETSATMFRPRAWDWCFLAMSHHRLGHMDKASHCVAMANQWIDQANSNDPNDLSDTHPAWGDWHESVVYPVLLSETEALVGKSSENRASTLQ
jgi:tetratricopeptide (TPR) repeat protein